MKTYYLYILSAKNPEKFLIDITDDLFKTVSDNKIKLNTASKQNKYKLVYYEKAGSVLNAISCRKKILKWDNVWKKILIEYFNPGWKDLEIKNENIDTLHWLKKKKVPRPTEKNLKL